ncbi:MULTISPECIES: hypothetical protein [unclassified Roseitalea]|uniref:hypothetical protein n=1 Tax=unclassified Roseitalea TaxID=2639107 RepID=UPI00273D670C|nr:MULTISPECIES: hypothetical protein [unclassified Roseitalea]
MRKTTPIVCVALMFGAPASTVWAEPADTTVYRQNAPVNVKVLVLAGPAADDNVRIEQTGRFNAAAVVSRQGGGYTAIYQSGMGNSAFGGRGGRNSDTQIHQVQTFEPPAFEPRRSGIWRRR